MADFREQRACIKFCFRLGKTATECYQMLKTTFEEQAMCRSQTFQWFSWFKPGRNSFDDDERSGRPVSSSTPEMIERVSQIIREDRRRITDEVSMPVGIIHGTCHKRASYVSPRLYVYAASYEMYVPDKTAAA